MWPWIQTRTLIGFELLAIIDKQPRSYSTVSSWTAARSRPRNSWFALTDPHIFCINEDEYKNVGRARVIYCKYLPFSLSGPRKVVWRSEPLRSESTASSCSCLLAEFHWCAYYGRPRNIPRTWEPVSCVWKNRKLEGEDQDASYGCGQCIYSNTHEQSVEEHGDCHAKSMYI